MVNKSQLLAVKKLNANSWKIGAGRNAHVITDMGFVRIKTNVLGRSSTLEIGITVSEGYVGIFIFTVKELKNDAFLRALLFGRSTTNYQFCATNAIVAQLTENYISYCTKIIPENEFDFSSNCGYQLEDMEVSDGAKKTTAKMDKGYKVDFVKEHRNVQAKCSLKHYGTNGKSYSHSKTNKSVKG